MDFSREWQNTAKKVDVYLREKIPQLMAGSHPGLVKLREAVEYSCYDGGKRFRPVLALWSYETLTGDQDKALPYAAAVEMVHCYSLIHDDLPSMDDDDVRRGRPSNHKAFGEAMALLAGSALLTEAFSLLADAYKEDSESATQLIGLLSVAAGARGMVGGQAIDILDNPGELSSEDLNYLHSLKTGALIKCAAVGAAVIAKTTEAEEAHLRRFAEHLGLAFQVADDVLDYNPEQLEPRSYPAVIGLADTRQFLKDITENALKELDIFGPRAEKLRLLAKFNLERNK